VFGPSLPELSSKVTSLHGDLLYPEQQLLIKTKARAIRASFLTDRYADHATLLAAIKAVTQLDYRLMSAGPNSQDQVWHGISPQRVSELGARQYCRPGYRDGGYVYIWWQRGMALA
jgi:hypothetical protein